MTIDRIKTSHRKNDLCWNLVLQKSVFAKKNCPSLRALGSAAGILSLSVVSSCSPRSFKNPSLQVLPSNSSEPQKSIANPSSSEEDKSKTPGKSGPAGFLFPVGGGASSGNNGSLKPAQVEIHKAALAQMQAQKAAGATAGTDVCIVEYHTDNPDTASTIALVEKLFVAAGKPDNEVRGYVFDTTQKSNDDKVVSELSKKCGLVFFPGGDQTQMRDLWSSTLLKKAFENIFESGGGIMGKSAGAALQGSIGYFPEANADPSAGALAVDARVSRAEFGKGFLGINLKGMPSFYIETHAGDRERTARALSLLASWDDLQNNVSSEQRNQSTETPLLKGNKNSAVGIVVDADTGVLIHFDAAQSRWTGNVYGARVAEFLAPTSSSQLGLAAHGQPIATAFSSQALLSGGQIALSGTTAGSVLVHNKNNVGAPRTEFVSAGANLQGSSCLANLPATVDGKYDADAAKASQVQFEARDPATGKTGDINSVEYAYLSGDLIIQKGSGCGYWQSNAFNPDYGRPENRLNAQRFVLSAGLAAFSVAVPPSIEVRAAKSSESAASVLEFVARTGDGSASLVYDLSHAKSRTVGTYVYQELGYAKAAQLGGWENGIVHLLPANSRFDLSSMSVVK